MEKNFILYYIAYFNFSSSLKFDLNLVTLNLTFYFCLFIKKIILQAAQFEIYPTWNLTANQK
jgi:hypothetical protein